MSEFILMTDSTADMPESFYCENQIPVLSLTYTLDDYTYTLADSLPMTKFYDKLRQGAMPVTSQVNPEAALMGFREAARQDKDILCVCFSSALSGTYNSCRIAAQMLSEEGFSRRIVVIDSLCASTGMGLLLYQANQMKVSGASLDETASWIEAHKLNVCHVFTVDDLNHLYRGGRVSKTAAIVGSMISIKPILHVDDAGTLQVIGKVPGRNKSLKTLVDLMEEKMGSWKDKNEIFMICQGDVQPEAEQVAQMVKDRFGISQSLISYTGPVIGSHTGAGVIGLFFMGDHR